MILINNQKKSCKIKKCNKITGRGSGLKTRFRKHKNILDKSRHIMLAYTHTKYTKCVDEE